MSRNVIEAWNQDCVCPWVWAGKSKNCPYGDGLQNSVSKAHIIYLKNQLVSLEIC